MIIAYVAGPYNADSRRKILINIFDARDTAIELWKIGFATICPQLNSAFFGDDVPEERFLPGYLRILETCDLIVLLPTWEESPGARREEAYAKEHNIPRYFWPEDRVGLEVLASGHKSS